ncbi:MAG: hypothetical protein RL385_5294 [Pseudomonadota bacterium]|jgi:hypothetical protein
MQNANSNEASTPSFDGFYQRDSGVPTDEDRSPKRRLRHSLCHADFVDGRSSDLDLVRKTFPSTKFILRSACEDVLSRRSELQSAQFPAPSI